MSEELAEPVDWLHGACIAARAYIDHQYDLLKARLKCWEPRPLERNR